MPLLATAGVTVLAVVITPVESPFPWTVTVASSVVCLVVIGWRYSSESHADIGAENRSPDV